MNLNILLFLKNLLGNIRYQDPAFKILLGDFNARSKSWWVHGIINNEGKQTESISSLYGFSQLISEATHILQNSSSCIHHLFFKDQPNLAINSGIKPTLPKTCISPTLPKTCLGLQKCQCKLNPKGFKHDSLE